MIKKDTIVSTTDGRLTLLQWLKKVEDALKNASATAVKGVPQADGKVVFEIDFADGTSIKSDPFQLPEKLPDGYAVDASGNITLNGGLHVDNAGNVEMGKNAVVDGTLTLNDPQNLIFKTGSINPIPEGYAVDDAGNVTIAGAITANNNGDVQVGKNLAVNGMATFGGGKNAIYQKTKIENLGGTELSSTMGFLLLSGVGLSAGGQTMLSNGPACLFLFNEEGAGDGATAKIGVPRNASGEIISSIAADDFSPYATFGTARRIVIANEDDQLQENVIYVDNLTSKSAVPAIDAKFCLSDNPTVSLAKLATASQAKYQHTVHITSLDDADKQLNISFTAMSSKSTPVISYQWLHEIFGGCNFAVSGNAKYYQMQLPVYLDLHGGTMDTDKIYVSSGISVGAYQQPTLSSFPNITFTDDVCIPK